MQQTEQQSTSARALLRGDEVDRRCGISRSQRHNLIRDRKFPPGFLLCGTRRRVWDSLEIDNWIAEQVEQARADGSTGKDWK